ncbi:MAG: PIN domain-containing protein [Chloroflexota bacterium]
MITLDTSAILVLLNRQDPDFQAVHGALMNGRAPYLVPAGIVGELAYMVSARFGEITLDKMLADVEGGFFALDCGAEDLPRIRALIRRYGNLPLGYADAAVIACAERNGGSVLSVDRRDFSIVAGEGRLTLLPA